MSVCDRKSTTEHTEHSGPTLYVGRKRWELMESPKVDPVSRVSKLAALTRAIPAFWMAEPAEWRICWFAEFSLFFYHFPFFFCLFVLFTISVLIRIIFLLILQSHFFFSSPPTCVIFGRVIKRRNAPLHQMPCTMMSSPFKLSLPTNISYSYVVSDIVIRLLYNFVFPFWVVFFGP